MHTIAQMIALLPSCSVRLFFRALGYLGVTTRLPVVDVVEPVEAVADAVLGQILVAVRTALRFDARDVAHIAQIDNELLVKVGLLGGPGVATFKGRGGGGWIIWDKTRM